MEKIGERFIINFVFCWYSENSSILRSNDTDVVTNNLVDNVLITNSRSTGNISHANTHTGHLSRMRIYCSQKK